MWVCWRRTTQTEIFHTTLPVKGISHEIFCGPFLPWINIHAVEPMLVLQFSEVPFTEFHTEIRLFDMDNAQNNPTDIVYRS
jgi:hypothetical protein